MKKRGFTLIELLAVIIILAIIALIATPIIMRVIENSKKGTAERGAENYLHQVETQAMALRTEGTILDGTYEIKSNGNLCLDKSTTCDESGEIKIEMSGTKPGSGSVVITTLTIGYYIATINESGSATAVKYIQKFKPQYYIWNLQGQVGEINAPASPSTEPPTGKNFYLGYDVADGKVSAGYVCFKRNGREYCLKGYDRAAYTTNQEIIADAYAEVADTRACSFGSWESKCNAGDSSAFARGDGVVRVPSDDVASCYVSYNAHLACVE